MANKGNEWARNELGDAALGDKRLTDRLVNIADSLTPQELALIERVMTLLWFQITNVIKTQPLNRFAFCKQSSTETSISYPVYAFLEL